MKVVHAVAALLALCTNLQARGEVKPNRLFSDHAVLQSGMTVPVWGTATPGEKVTLAFNGQRQSTTANAAGTWRVNLNKLLPGGPFVMTITGSNVVTINDVLVGEDWIGSGQSNMAFTVSKKAASFAGMKDEDSEIAAADYPQLRIFMAKPAKAYAPLTEIEGDWKIASPENAGAFSAVGYLFGRNLNKQLKVPVGMIIVAYGASTAESWVSRPVLNSDPELKPMLDRFDALALFYKEHPGATTDQAPGAPQTLNARASKPGPLKDPVQDQHQPTVLYNGMVHPIVPFAMRGVLWYQGESIVGGKDGLALYPHVMAALVNDWRAEWGEGPVPFYCVQLAPLKNASNNPVVREGQAKLLELPNTGMVVTLDVGDPTNVHPKDKEPVADRLSRIALAKVYGRKIEFSGPIYTAMTIYGAQAVLTFSHAEGMAGKDGPLRWFQIAGADGKYWDAIATVQNKSVVVSSDQVATPVSVRYAWDNYPVGANLVNGAGLPAAPFRTDNQDVATQASKEFTGK